MGLMKKLIDSYSTDYVSFSYFRFIFYSVTLYFYLFINNIFSNWGPVDSNFWQPISFFKYFSYSFVISANPHVLYWIFTVSMSFCAVGLFFRFSSVVSFLVFLFAAGLPCNFGKIHHSNHMTAVLLGLLCLVPVGKASVDSFFQNSNSDDNENEKIWAWFFFTVTAYMALVYGSAGLQKLRNTGWSWTSNESMVAIILTRPTVTPFGVWVAQSDWLGGILAKYALLLEFFAPLAIFLKNPKRVFYGFLLFMLHQGMYWTLGDHGAFFPYQICFLAWVPWSRIHFQINAMFGFFRTRLNVQEKLR